LPSLLFLIILIFSFSQPLHSFFILFQGVFFLFISAFIPPLIVFANFFVLATLVYLHLWFFVFAIEFIFSFVLKPISFELFFVFWPLTCPAFSILLDFTWLIRIFSILFPCLHATGLGIFSICRYSPQFDQSCRFWCSHHWPISYTNLRVFSCPWVRSCSSQSRWACWFTPRWSSCIIWHTEHIFFWHIGHRAR
jgi:hypothetical protein